MEKHFIFVAILGSLAAVGCNETNFNKQNVQQRTLHKGAAGDSSDQMPAAGDSTAVVTSPIAQTGLGPGSADGGGGKGENANGGDANGGDPYGGDGYGGNTDGGGTPTDKGGDSSTGGSCSSTNTCGGGSKDPGKQPDGDEEPVKPAPPPISRPDVAIKHCLDAWKGQHPFNASTRYRKINVGSFLGTAAFTWDARRSSEPELIYVYSDFSSPLPLAIGTYHLQNPNGWYCLDVDFDRNKKWQPKELGSVIGIPVPSIGDVGLSSVVVTCNARLVQVRHSGGDLARFVSILRLHLLPPIPCFDGRDHLVKYDWQLPLIDIAGTVF